MLCLQSILCHVKVKLSRNQSWVNLTFSVSRDSILKLILNSQYSRFAQESRVETCNNGLCQQLTFEWHCLLVYVLVFHKFIHNSMDRAPAMFQDVIESHWEIKILSLIFPPLWQAHYNIYHKLVRQAQYLEVETTFLLAFVDSFWCTDIFNQWSNIHSHFLYKLVLLRSISKFITRNMAIYQQW